MFVAWLVPTPHVVPAIRASGDPWQRIDAGPFSFLAPADMTRTPRRGIDSLVAEYENQDCRLSFDYGIYSNSLRELAGRPEFAEEEAEIDGRAARLVSYVEPSPAGTVDTSGPAGPEGATSVEDFPYRTAVHFADLGPGLTVGDRVWPVKLTMVVSCRERSYREIALSILHSIIFTR
jgi:hypothetical protein